MMGLFRKAERALWAPPLVLTQTQASIGLTALNGASRFLYERALPRRVPLPRFLPDRPPLNYWMAPYDLMQHAYVPGQIILGKIERCFLGHLDDRPMVTIANARAGKTSTVLEP